MVILSRRDFQIFLLIILWGKCMLGINCGQTGIKLLCNYGKLDQLNSAVWCASSVCGVSLAHLNYTKHPMFRSVYCFHVYYHVRRILKNCRCFCHTRPVLMQLIILILSENFKKFVRIMESLTIL